MAAEDFFARWSKKKAGHVADSVSSLESSSADSVVEKSTAADGAVDADADADKRTLPTMEDVDRLTHDSDYSVFMARGVDESVRRSAMKKLFSDPHFNVMDGLDVYIEDFTKFEPITPAMLASLSHVKELLEPNAHLETLRMRLLDAEPQQDGAAVSSIETKNETKNETETIVADVPVDSAATATHHQDPESSASSEDDVAPDRKDSV